MALLLMLSTTSVPPAIIARRITLGTSFFHHGLALAFWTHLSLYFIYLCRTIRRECACNQTCHQANAVHCSHGPYHTPDFNSNWATRPVHMEDSGIRDK